MHDVTIIIVAGIIGGVIIELAETYRKYKLQIYINRK